ncbi:MAG TPA: hypothetical protein ENJ79_11390 [Gammaproteobacteria bacterium]|nr:hypothetical protein [Gammaproteobacteria bacterium]
MPKNDLKELIGKISVDDLSVNADGTVTIANPDLAAKLKETGALKPKDLAKDTNIICCGNDSCGGKFDSLIDQMLSSRIRG